MNSLLLIVLSLSSATYGACSNSSWARLPDEPTIPVEPYTVNISQATVNFFENDLTRSMRLQETFENSGRPQYGVELDWMSNALEQWRTNFSWRQTEASINRHPHFLANVPIDETTETPIHFMALFSQNPEAIPIAFFHGWPGNFLEFMQIFDILKEDYTPETSPYHLIAPSLPGFALSPGSPSDFDWNAANVSVVMDNLLRGIGFEGGYVAQGGDIGSFIAQGVAAISDSCRAAHLNFIASIRPSSVPAPENDTTLTQQDREILTRSQNFVETQQAYALEQGTKPATLGFALASHPYALLAWLSEKFLTWTDPSTPLSLDEILTHVSLYHLTGTIERSFYSYRETSYSLYPPPSEPAPIEKPFGYSRFPYDVSAVPRSWAEVLGDLVFYRAHEEGGHFPASELPRVLWEDVQEFISVALPNGLE